MSWACRMIELLPNMDFLDDMRVGDMFFYDQSKDPYFKDSPTDEEQEQYFWPRCYAKAPHLSQFYRDNNSHRLPLLVVVPGPTLFAIDGMCNNETGRYGGWTVTGEPPFITVSPSINIGGTYHGWLQNGVISDECEGRQYTEAGVLIRKPI